MILWYGKLSAPLLTLKDDFIPDNATLANNAEDLCKLSAEQSRFEHGKNYADSLGPTSFTKLGADYVIGASYGHLNSAHKDTQALFQTIYTNDGGWT